MKTCNACGTHVRTSDCTCPHCGEKAACAAHTRGTPAVALLGLALAACPDPDGKDTWDSAGLQDTYGVTAYVDEDGDGWTESDGDCDDANAAINPDATETAGDGVDSNCDGTDDS